MSAQTFPTTVAQSGTRSEVRSAGRTAAALLALALGGLLLWGVGFAHNDRLHNAAHDTRHSNGFPCH